MLFEHFLRRGEGRLVVVGAPLASPLASDGVESNAFGCDCRENARARSVSRVSIVEETIVEETFVETIITH